MKVTKDILQAVSQLEIHSRKGIAALLSGNYKSPFRGAGTSFTDFRPYEPGDDVRHISWQVTARTTHTALKLYEEERELNVVLVVDLSGSSLFGINAKQRRDMYAELVALLGLAAVHAGDNVGALYFNDSPLAFFKPKKSKNQVLTGLEYLLSQEILYKKSNLSSALKTLSISLKTPSMIFVLSDFMVPDFSHELTMLSQKHEIILLHCYDDAERLQSVDGILIAEDPETGDPFLLDASSKDLKLELAKQFTENLNRLEMQAKALDVDVLSLCMNDDYVKRLVQYFHHRRSSRF